MRKFSMAAIMLLAGAHGASAADMPDMLRGSYVDQPLSARPLWEGLYIGGQVSSGWIEAKPGPGYNTGLQNAYVSRTGLGYGFPGLATASGRSTGYGGFIGYNSQFEDVVVGIEANYLRQNLGAYSNNTQLNYAADGTYVTTVSNASVRLTDFGSLRLRAGYTVGGFLPYVFAGVAGGMASYAQSAGVTGTTTVPSPLPNPLPALQTSAQNDRFIYGYAAGAGVDVALFGGLFLRAEYEYLRFTSRIDTTINSVRAGLAYKF
jgi:outer membrane immunogenic protein